MKVTLNAYGHANHKAVSRNSGQNPGHRAHTTQLRTLGTAALFLLMFFLLPASSWAQTCNLQDTLNTANHPGVTQNSGFTVGGAVTAPANIIGATSASTTLTSIVGASAFVEVTKATPATPYAAGTYTGFNVTNASLLGLLNNITITTFLASTQQEAVSGSSIAVTLGLSGSAGNYSLGFKTTKTFDRVRITLSGVANSIDVYYAFVESFCAGPALSCNKMTNLTAPTYPVVVDVAQTGLLGAGTVANSYNVKDADTSNFASITTTVAAGSGGSIAIKENVTTYTSGTFVAFDIASTSLLGVNLLSDVSISTYAAGVRQDSVVGAALVNVNPSLLSSSNGRTTVGFRTTHNFDEVKITVANTLGVAYTVNVYGLYMESFCAGTALSCNTLTGAISPNLPVYVDGSNTGINNIATVGGSLNAAQNAVDNDTNSYATISLTAGVASTANFAVADALNIYPANSFAGFDIEMNTQLLTAGALSNAVIYLYNNGTLVQTGSGSALIVGATSSLLAPGTTRQVVGIIANTTYNEVRISFNQLAGATLGNIKIYSAILEKTCTPTILCSAAYYLNSPSFPTVIDAALSGVSGVATVDANVADAWNVVSASTTDYARVYNNATVVANAAIAVQDPITTYPKGTFAGFVIKPGNTPAILANLLSAITISTYNNGVLQESATGGSLINLTVLATIIGTPASGSYNIGFYTTQPFDEVVISVGSLVNAGLLSNTYVDVYGAFIDTRTSVAGSGALSCALANPDVNTGLINTPIPGNVSTNDVIASGATYSSPAAPTAAPSGSTATLTVNADGSYNFSANKIGVYLYDVPYCVTGSTTTCSTEPLKITVTDTTTNLNPPIVNTDMATTNTGQAVTIKVRANDGVGSSGHTLGNPTIVTQPKNGTASVDANGNIVYTPNAGFNGDDTLVYQVCEIPAGQCGTAFVYITVNGTTAAVSATDDYAFTSRVNPATGNVLTNDISTAGNTLTAVPQNLTLTQGSFVLNGDGSYSFTPNAGFSGTVDIPYRATDAVTSTFANATLHVVVNNMALVPLPIKLTSFTAIASGCNAIISWHSASERDFSHFTLQYSQNGVDYQNIAIINGKGDNSDYLYEHHAGSGRAMYRLLLTDNNGSVTYSNTVVVNISCGNQTAVQIVPNPVQNSFSLRIENGNAAYTAMAKLYNATGMVVRTLSVHNGDNLVDMTGLAAGMYTVVLQDANGVSNYKLTKQ